ncbi:MAG: hypothetical protein J6C81_06775 [Muribaculaceae bacterium]|nr:hypothetical protein [Muribaculaceae bacterium]
METLTNEQRQVADQLRNELSETYSYVYPNTYSIERFVIQGWARPENLNVHNLYDFLLSQGLCEVEE